MLLSYLAAISVIDDDDALFIEYKIQNKKKRKNLIQIVMGHLRYNDID